MPPIPVDATSQPAGARRTRSAAILRAAALVLAGVLLGAGGSWLVHDPHTARGELLSGTVTWSNPDTRLIAFQVDGHVRRPDEGDTFYTVTGAWTDRAGTVHGSGEGYPTCLPQTLAANEPRRVRLDVVNVGTGPQPVNIALMVYCLD